MVVSKNYGIVGQFKFDVYQKNGNLKYTTDYIDNFITSTGLEYIKTFAFADCFRYLSLGSGTAANSITSNGGNGTTDLTTPIERFRYIGGNTSNFNCTEGDYNHYIGSACGYRINPTGLVLTRAWRIPVTNNTFFTEQYTFEEYMLSPGRTGLNGFAYNEETALYDIPHVACSCIESTNDEAGEIKGYGKEAPDFYAAYPSICSANKAFSRILKQIDVEVDEYLVVNYALNVVLSNASVIKQFSVTPDRTYATAEDPWNWGVVTGISSLVVPGIKLINNGDVTSVDYANQMSDNYTFRAGESFVPPLGIAMEPSCPVDHRWAYLSTDNLQFKVNDMNGGGLDVDVFKPYKSNGREFPSGTIGFHKDYVTETSDSTANLGSLTLEKTWAYRPRTERDNNEITYWPSQSDFKTSVSYTAISDTLINTVTSDTTFYPYHEIPDAADVSATFVSAAMSNRARTQKITFQFHPQTSPYSKGTPARAFVYAYRWVNPNNGDKSVWLATLDSIIAPKNASYTGTMVTGAVTNTYGNPLGYLESSEGAGHYWTNNNNILLMQVNVTWSSPCPAGVEGC